MGSDVAAASSPADQSSTKKRFSNTEQSSAAETLLLSSLEAGVLKLERDSSADSGGGGNGLPLRARLAELLSFLAWLSLIASCCTQYAMVWVSFWMRIEELRTRSTSFHRRSVALPLWGLWVAALLCYRRTIYKRINPDMVCLFRNAEILSFVVLFMTGEFAKVSPACPLHVPRRRRGMCTIASVLCVPKHFYFFGLFEE